YAAPRLTVPPSPSPTPPAPLELQSPSYPFLLPLTGNTSTACCNKSLGVCPAWKPHPWRLSELWRSELFADFRRRGFRDRGLRPFHRAWRAVVLLVSGILNGGH